MTGAEALDELARLAGIEEGWWDFFGTWRVVPAETKRAFLEAMGYGVDSDQACIDSLIEAQNRPWLRWLEPVTVLDAGAETSALVLTLPASLDTDLFTWHLDEEDGAGHDGRFQADTLPWREERWIDGALYKRWSLVLPETPPLGYHRFALTGPDDVRETAAVIVAPDRAYIPEAVEGGAKAWGIATQIYALKRRRDWGVGTYSALGHLAAGIGRLGGAAIGINPLHALYSAQPRRFSPYAPSSRRFLNVGYIDVEAIPEYGECATARVLARRPHRRAIREALHRRTYVDYPGVAAQTRPVLEELYRHFRRAHLARGDNRARAFRRFQEKGGTAALRFCTFEALHERFIGCHRAYWRRWPSEYRHPASPAVAAFAKARRERVEFFWWLQFIADEQLAAAHEAGREAGAAIGLYRDLGVGIAGDGADSWLEQDSLALGVSVGAPPDPLALKGQDWGLVPFNPVSLREAAYRPFIAVMEANMRHAGALRLDHAMALQRLYWVPEGAAADQGAYVRYPVDDLFRLVALESQRNSCLIIGEDLGTVPDGFRERMGRMGLFAYRVMVFEKTGDQRFRAPEEFDEQALAIFATHDLPSLRGWWDGIDIDKRTRLDLYPRPGMAEEERAGRDNDRRALVTALAERDLLPADFPLGIPISEAAVKRLATAAHAYLIAARSRLMMVQIEDVMGLEGQMNLPGTCTQHPNWRWRFPMNVEAVLGDRRMVALAKGMDGRRGVKRRS